MIPRAFTYTAPESLAEAVALLEVEEGARVLAGGQTLLNSMKLRSATPKALVDLRNIEPLQHIETQVDGSLRVGAMTTFTQIVMHHTCQHAYPALVQAANATAGCAIRNYSTLGGNLAQRAIGADLPAVVQALDATIHYVGPQGPRSISADELCSGRVSLAGNEIITFISLPAIPVGALNAYTKVKNRATGNALCGVAVQLVLAADKTVQTCRIVATGIAEYTVRLTSIEQALSGKTLTRDAIADVEWLNPPQGLITDLAASAEYRAYMTVVLAQHALMQVEAQLDS